MTPKDGGPSKDSSNNRDSHSKDKEGESSMVSPDSGGTSGHSYAHHSTPGHSKSQPSPNPNHGTRGNLASQPGTDAESLSDMSVRGLDLLKYAHIASDGSYRCIQCEKVQINKSFKNKYSFQRHAFLYHEGANRKVFPCPVCQKEFSRPDKMKQHLKQVHDCIIPKHETQPQHHPSHFLINPFLAPLDDPSNLETAQKISNLKHDSGRDVFKLMTQIASHTANLQSPGGQGASWSRHVNRKQISHVSSHVDHGCGVQHVLWTAHSYFRLSNSQK